MYTWALIILLVDVLSYNYIHGLCRFGDVNTGCALPCTCTAGSCNQTTGECSGPCPNGPPGGYRWHGPGCQIGNVAYGRTTRMFNEKNAKRSPLAVDGSAATSTCAETKDEKTNVHRAWWYVDLGSLHKITRFTLVNKMNTGTFASNLARILGYLQIGLANGTNTNTWNSNCYKSGYEWANGGTKGFDCVNNNVGRYFYIWRFGGFHTSRLHLCETILEGYKVIVDECGDQCETTCNSLTGCEKCNSGYKYPDCKTACTAVSWGDNCEETCPGNCVQTGQICNISSGACDQCNHGYWGEKCEETCPVNCVQTGDICDRQTGECSQSGCNETGPEEDWFTGNWCNVTIDASVIIVQLEFHPMYKSIEVRWRSNISADIADSYGYQLTFQEKTFNNMKEESRTFKELEMNTFYLASVTIYRTRPDGTVVLLPNSTAYNRGRTLMEKETTTTTTTTTTSPPVVAAASRESSSIVPIAGGVAGGVLFLLICVALVIFFLFRMGKLKWPPGQSKDVEQNIEEGKSTRSSNGKLSKPGYEMSDSVSKEKSETESAASVSEGYQESDEDEEENEEEEKDVVEDDLYVNTTLRNTCVKVMELEKYIKDSGEELEEEFFRLKRGFIKPCTVGTRESKMDQNRYKNIIPYDENRVQLMQNSDDETDYINASYMKGYNGKKRVYVASQGPNKKTVNDMWMLIWQTETCQVVMVTQCVENGKIKCEQYWPDVLNKPTEYGNISVTLTEERVYANYKIKTFQLVKGTGTRKVYHFHYHAWPDKTPPEHPHELLEFRNKINSYSVRGTGPILTHCSAGVGRTGTLIALDILLQMIQKEQKVNVFKVVNVLREDRMNMVQTPAQYAFIYYAVLDYHKTGHTRIPCADLKTEYQDLQKDEGAYTNESKLEAQFQMLSELSDLKNLYEADEDKCVGLLDLNEKKNFAKDIIPSDKNRVKLHSPNSDRSDYINAVYVNTFTKRDGLIVTQTPTNTTKCDFWSTVYENNCPVIIHVKATAKDDQTSGNDQDWRPSDEASVSYNKYAVTLIETNQEKTHTKMDFQITRKGRQGTHAVRLIELTCDEDGLPEIKQVLAVLEIMDDWKHLSKLSGPPVLMCRNGADLSGLLAASVHIRQRLQMDSDVDVLNSVRVVTTNRTQFIPTVEQYQFLYELALECSSDGDVYANV